MPVNHGMLKYFMLLKSTLAKPGPRKLFRPPLPSVPLAGWLLNVVGSRQPVKKAETSQVLPFPDVGALAIAQLKPSVTTEQSCTVYGYPPCSDTAPVHCHPPRILRTTGFMCVSFGSSQIPCMVKLFGTSKAAGPICAFRLYGSKTWASELARPTSMESRTLVVLPTLKAAWRENA